MGWRLIYDATAATSTDTSVTVALIAALGTVAVALLGLLATWIARSSSAEPPPPPPTVQLNERVAVTEVRVQDSTRTLDVLDRHVDKIGDDLEHTKWRLEQLAVRVEEHLRGDTP